MRIVLKILLGLVVIVVVAVGAFVAWAASVPAIDPVAQPDDSTFDTALVEKGELLAGVGDCAVCHTAPDGQEFAGGLALPTPFGTIYSTNITPDPETGIGTWSEDAFRRALHEGVDREGNYLYPAFPYDHFTRVTDEDVHAIYAYLMTREPVSATAPDNELPFPFNIRLLIAGWNLLFFDEGVYQPDPEQDEEWNRGAYLAEGLGHCGACHTPRNFLGATDQRRHFDGGEAEFWHAPALNANSPAPAGWTADQLVNYLIDGWDGDHGIAAGPMTPVVNNVANLPEDDVYAIAAYLMSFMPEPSEEKAEAARAFAEEREFSGSMMAAGGGEQAEGPGFETFARVCANCHRQGGQTVPLGLSSTMWGSDPRNAIHIVMDGIQPPNGVPAKTMPRFGDSLSDEQITDLVNFLRERFSDRPAWPDVAARVSGIRNRSE